MADAPQPRPSRDVIPLHPERIARPAGVRFPAALLAAFRELRVPAELAALFRVNARRAARFFAPALLLAAGAALLALLAGSAAAALGMRGVSPGAVSATAGAWTLLATAGGALGWRGARLASARWR
jgi:hypothetical protein